MYPCKNDATIEAAVMNYAALYEEDDSVGVVWWVNDTKHTRLLMWDKIDNDWVPSIEVEVDMGNPSSPSISLNEDDRFIQMVATALYVGACARDIRSMLRDEGMTDDAAMLCYVAGKLLYEHRVNPELVSGGVEELPTFYITKRSAVIVSSSGE